MTDWERLERRQKWKERGETLFHILAALGLLLMAFRAFTGTKPGTFPPEPWCETNCVEKEAP